VGNHHFGKAIGVSQKEVQAQKARLEAERMDADLTLRKITWLECALAKAKGPDSVEKLQRDMAALQAKLTG
jgi:hypothetical protein